METGTAIALPIALASTTLTNIAYLREHDAAASLPALSIRRPLHSARLLLTDRRWLLGFGLESVGFLLYALALAMSSLALVQSVGAGGIGILAFVTSRLGRRRLSRRERTGAMLATLGLLFLGLSLLGGSGAGGHGTIVVLVLWLGASAAAAVAVLALGRGKLDRAVAAGIAGGIFFSIGDISTKAATAGGVRIAFLVTLVVGYTAGTALLQIGYQAGGTLTVAGLATLFTNALPIAAGTAILGEELPGGAYGGLRVAAFAAVTAGAFLLARPKQEAAAEPAADAGSGLGPVVGEDVAPEDEVTELIHADSLPRRLD